MLGKIGKYLLTKLATEAFIKRVCLAPLSTWQASLQISWMMSWWPLSTKRYAYKKHQ